MRPAPAETKETHLIKNDEKEQTWKIDCASCYKGCSDFFADNFSSCGHEGASVAANQLEFNHYMAHRPLCQCCQPLICCEELIRLHREWRSNNEELVILFGFANALNPIPTRLFWA